MQIIRNWFENLHDTQTQHKVDEVNSCSFLNQTPILWLPIGGTIVWIWWVSNTCWFSRCMDDNCFSHLHKSQTTLTILQTEECHLPSYDTLDFVPKVGNLGGAMWLWGAGQLLCHTRMANSALKCRITILIIAMSFCSYSNILINFGQLYSNSCYTIFSIATLGMCIHSMWISSTLGSEALYLWHVSAPHKVTYFMPNWPCMYSSGHSIMN